MPPEDDEHDDDIDEPQDDHDDDGGGADDDGDDPALTAIRDGFSALGDQLGALVKGRKEEPVTTTSRADDGAGVEDQVRRALAKVGKEQETDERLSKVEKIVERPPRKQSWLERKIWGTVDA